MILWTVYEALDTHQYRTTMLDSHAEPHTVTFDVYRQSDYTRWCWRWTARCRGNTISASDWDRQNLGVDMVEAVRLAVGDAGRAIAAL